MEKDPQITEEEFETNLDYSSSTDSYEEHCRTESVDMEAALAYSKMNFLTGSRSRTKKAIHCNDKFI